MKRFFASILIVVLVLGLCACGTDLSGKYYCDDMAGVYYEFDGDDTCYLVIESQNMSVEYRYVLNEDEMNNTYVIHISDVNSGVSHKLIYDANTDSVYDFELGNFSK